MSDAPELMDEKDYLSDTPIDPQPQYPQLRETFETAIIITNLPQVSYLSLVLKFTKHVTCSR